MLSPGFWLQQAALAWRAELETRLRPLGLTPTQFTLLAAVGWLEYIGDPPTQQQVAEQAGADRMMTSKVVRVLAQRDLLVRRPHESSARALRLALTAAGRATLDHATRLAREVDMFFFGADPAALRAALRAIAQQRAREDLPRSPA
jgi:DNA-binding MarR family transcriptional regulator